MFKYTNTIKVANIDTECDLLIDKIHKQDWPEMFEQFLFYCLSELLNNVQEHSKAKTVSISLDVKQLQLSLMVSDQGIGLKKSYISSGVYPKDDLSAVQFALSGLSAKNLKERGYGLYSIKNFVVDLNGIIRITSGQVSVSITSDGMKFDELSKNYSGTKINLQVPVKSVDFYKNIE